MSDSTADVVLAPTAPGERIHTLDVLRGFAHVDDLHVEVQVLAGHRVVEVDVDHTHADLLDGHGARAEVGLQHDLHARLQALVLSLIHI